MDERPEEDGGQCARVRELLPQALQGRVSVIVPASLDAALAALHGADVLLAMRLHALILSAGITPTVCLSRGGKTDAIAAELGIPLRCTRAPSFATLGDELSALIFAQLDAQQRAQQLASVSHARSLQCARLASYFDRLAPLLEAAAPRLPGVAGA
jgi:polysaccharide pyruvyl transferase WcaK-like protein